MLRTDAPRGAVAAQGKRPVYPYSVVPGGAYTPEELSAAMRDRVVAAHYAGLHASRVRPVVLERDRRAYVSFRMHNAVYWTRRPVKLAQGEHLLTDGENFVRARCGNRVSDIPRMPTTAEEPPEALMDHGEAIAPTPLSPGRSLAIVPVEPSVLPHELALWIPPAPAGSPSFGPISGPVPFLSPGGGVMGGTPVSPAQADAPSVTPQQPGGPVYDVPTPQPLPYTPGDIPWPRPEPVPVYYPPSQPPTPPANPPTPPTTPPTPPTNPPTPPTNPPTPPTNPPTPPTNPPTPPTNPPTPPPYYPPTPPYYPPTPPTNPPTPPSVPEPGTLALVPGALAVLWLASRRRR
jgi:hypothetical protein